MAVPSVGAFRLLSSKEDGVVVGAVELAFGSEGEHVGELRARRRR